MSSGYAGFWGGDDIQEDPRGSICSDTKCQIKKDLDYCGACISSSSSA